MYPRNGKHTAAVGGILQLRCRLGTTYKAVAYLAGSTEYVRWPVTVLSAVQYGGFVTASNQQHDHFRDLQYQIIITKAQPSQQGPSASVSGPPHCATDV